MGFMIALSNMAGLSGAGASAPFFQIFHGMTMSEAVPLVSFVAMVSTVFRFILNYRQRHPKNPEKSSIDYEVVTVSIPLVFLGSFAGIILGRAIGELGQNIVFGITMAWSIYTSLVKGFELKDKEDAEIEMKA